MSNDAGVTILLLVVLGLFLGVQIWFILNIKKILLPKSRLHIAVGILLIGIALCIVDPAFGGIFCVLGGILSVLSVFIAKDLAGKYQPLLRRGKSTTAEHLSSILKKKNVDTVVFELHCLFDRGYLPGFTINYETHAITPASVQGLAEKVGETMSALKNIKGTQEKSLTCRKCGAENMAPSGSGQPAACEFCGSPLSRRS